MKILVGMSGGVDSSVTALRLHREGHEVIGLSFQIWDQRHRSDPGLCCSLESLRAAEGVCRRIGIPHFSVDLRTAFREQVIEPFCEAYIKGHTPNPCVLCNRQIKFRFLLEQARETSADAVATGHYARLLKDDGAPLLFRGKDPAKDQSYFLYVMTREEMEHTLFPLGELRKDEVRAMAEEAGLPTAHRPESQDICFIGKGRYGEFIRNFSPESVTPGDFVDSSGKVLGRHAGLAFYTVGQRRGLGIPAGHRLYVVRMDRNRNRVVLGRREEGVRRDFEVTDLNWTGPRPAASSLSVSARLRSTMKEAPAMLSLGPANSARVSFKIPQWSPAPGQAAVFYLGERVLGGGTITSSHLDVS